MFLAEAFTRPKMMYRLAKIGFSQSYTYFTWRNTKAELTEYLTELTTQPSRRILPAALLRQHARHQSLFPADVGPRRLPDPRRAGGDPVGPVGHLFRLRAVRGRAAARARGISRIPKNTRSAPGTSPRPATSSAEIAALNRLRRAHPALQSASRPDVLQRLQRPGPVSTARRRPDREDMILVAVSLDPHDAQEAAFEVPLWEWSCPMTARSRSRT